MANPKISEDFVVRNVMMNIMMVFHMNKHRNDKGRMVSLVQSGDSRRERKGIDDTVVASNEGSSLSRQNNSKIIEKKLPIVMDVVVCGVCGGMVPMDEYDCRCPEWHIEKDRQAKFIGRLEYEK